MRALRRGIHPPPQRSLPAILLEGSVPEGQKEAMAQEEASHGCGVPGQPAGCAKEMERESSGVLEGVSGEAPRVCGKEQGASTGAQP